MNKVILTHDRLFMAVVGPSGCGKTELIFRMLLNKTFYPGFQKVFYFFREYQNIFPKMQKLLPNIEFIQFTTLEAIAGIENALLIFDDSCEEIFNDKEFVKIATSGRHRKLGIIYVKHNLSHQSKFSRTIDLNTTHIVLFKSPRDVGQIDYLGKQLNNFHFLRDCYQKATASGNYGHLLIDLDPKTTDALRFCSNVTAPGITTFYLPREKAFKTTLTNERERRAYTERNFTII